MFFFFLSSPAPAKVFLALEKDIQKSPWKSCYTGSVQVAAQDVEQKQFPGGNDSNIRNLKISGNLIQFELYLFGNKLRDVSLLPCVFTDQDMSQTLHCEVDLQTYVDNSPRTQLGYLANISQAWKDRGFKTPVIDCAKNRVLVIRNKWRQPITLADYKIMTEIADIYHKPLTGAGMGFVRKGGSLLPHQDWSGEVQISFMEDLNSAEVFDASVEQFSAPGEIEKWFKENESHGPWTPWSIQFSSVKCPGLKEIIDATAPFYQPLDLSASEIQSYCKRRLSEYY